MEGVSSWLFLPVRVLSRYFRRVFLQRLTRAQRAGKLQFFGRLESLHDAAAFDALIAPLKKTEWIVYAKRPFSGPKAVLNYLSRYTHRVAIANSRLVALDPRGVTFKWKDYRAKQYARYKTMTVHADEFIRRFLIHTLPTGFHRIRHYGWCANTRADVRSKLRALLRCDETAAKRDHHPHHPTNVCPECGATMIISEVFERAHYPRAPPEPSRVH